MGPTVAPIATRSVSVRGGTNGITARMHDIIHLAGLYGAAGEHCGAQSVRMQHYLLDPAIIASAALDPIGAARFELAMAAALDGPHGLTMLAAECGTTGVALRATATTYVTADRLMTNYEAKIRGVVHAGAAVKAYRAADRGDGWSGAITGVNAAGAADPDSADTVAAVSRFWTNHTVLNRVRTLPDGRADVRNLGPDRTPEEQPPPRCLQNLFAGLAVRNRPAHGGDVDVRFVYTTDAAGHVTRRAIVDIPGQKNWEVPPTKASQPVQPDPTDVTTSLKSILGQTTTYEQGVLEAMRKAGVKRGEAVLLVGHSQGGMVAANLAATVAKTREFHVTSLVTAGSPIGRLHTPGSVNVLSIENYGDVVPHCDGADNPDRATQTTVTVNRNTGDALENHDLDDSYVPGAADVDASDDPSVRSYLKSVRAFLSGDRVVTKVFHIARV